MGPGPRNPNGWAFILGQWNYRSEVSQGILRSLLYQALSKRRDLTPVILPQHWGELFARCTHFSTAPILPLSEFGFNSNLRTLQQAFVRLKEELVTSKMCLFINGLDEYGGDFDEMARFLKDVARSPLIKVCVSSRLLVVFREAFKHSPTLRLQDLTYAYIVRCVDGRLNTNGRWL